MHTFLVFIGAGLGGIMRFWLTNISQFYLGKHFPWGTLFVNVSGCFLMGILFVLFFERYLSHGPLLRSLFLVGFLGGFTTFSSFSIETIGLIETGAFNSALLNILISVILGLAATATGIIIAKQF